jgi:hypothetical protein
MVEGADDRSSVDRTTMDPRLASVDIWAVNGEGGGSWIVLTLRGREDGSLALQSSTQAYVAPPDAGGRYHQMGKP